jgi:SAM-dependent methyltransferase
MSTIERDYVLGTGDAEIDRLRLQHAVWRADATAAWRVAGFRPGDTILDVGCGPGFASLDLSDVVGSDGRVVAIDQSRRFLDHLAAQCRARAVENVSVTQQDLASATLNGLRADGAWLRWILAFVPNPRRALECVVAALKAGGTIAIQEYFAYESWRLLPRDAEFEAFVSAVMKSWRARGGEPNVGLDIVPWLESMGLEIRSTRTITDVVTHSSHRWHWPTAFALSGLERLIELGDVTPAAGERMRARIQALRTEDAWMVTPGMIEVIARRPG